MLSSWGIPFDGVDVEAEPRRFEELTRRGIPAVPATIRGEAAVHGWNPRALAELVGAPYDAGARLGPDALMDRLDRVLAVAAEGIRGVPAGGLAVKTPGRDRTLRQLAFHIFRLSLGFAEGMASGRLTRDSLVEDPGPAMDTGVAIAGYGEGVRARLAAWRRQSAWCQGTVETYYGPQSALELLERTTWHATQHVRQLHALMESLAIAPPVPLTAADLAGLPLPAGVWD